MGETGKTAAPEADPRPLQEADPRPFPEGNPRPLPEVDPQRPFANPKAVAEAIAHLSPDDAQLFIAKLDQSLRRNRQQAMGYFAAAGLWLVGMLFALVYYGAAPSGQFVGWVFLLPFAVAGATLYIVGRWTSDR